MASALLRTKSPERLVAEAEAPDRKLKRSLGPLDLMALGVGATIGAGIFALTGTAAAGQQTATSSVLDTPVMGLMLGHAANGRPAAGPAIMISFLIVATACGFAGLCYAELAAMIPVAGSAYTYAYATLGELLAWIIGWDLILEYAVGNIAVASSWSGYFVKLCYSLLHWRLPLWLVTDPKTAAQTILLGASDPSVIAPFSSTTLPQVLGHSVSLNVPAFLIVVALTDGESQSLTHKECAVLRLLAERAGKAVSRDEILDRAWSADEFPTSRTVDNFIVRLRKLVELDAADPRVIRSIRGGGYLLTEVHRD